MDTDRFSPFYFVNMTFEYEVLSFTFDIIECSVSKPISSPTLISALEF